MQLPSANPKRGSAKAGPTKADRLFIELDQRRINGGARDALVQVLGIHVHTSGSWIQVSLADECPDGVLLHLPLRATVEQALAALTKWALAPPDARPPVVRVMRLA